MNKAGDAGPHPSDFPDGKVIFCVVPDDGTDKRVLAELRERYGLVRGSSLRCRGVGALADVRVRRGKLPESQLVKQISVVCSPGQADEIFDFIYWSARVNQRGRGIMWQQPAVACSPYALPADVPDEK